MLRNLIKHILIRIEIYRYTRLFKRLYWANLKERPQQDAISLAEDGFQYMTGISYGRWFNDAHKAIGSSRKISTGFGYCQEQIQPESKILI